MWWAVLQFCNCLAYIDDVASRFVLFSFYFDLTELTSAKTGSFTWPPDRFRC